MSISSFDNRDMQPSTVDVKSTLGASAELWDQLVKFIEDTFAIPGVWNFGGKNYGWNLWFKRAGRAIITLYPQVNGFTAQVVLGAKEVAKFPSLDIGEHVTQVFNKTPQLHDGRWLFIPVQSLQDVIDIQKLLDLKPKPRKVAAE